MPSPHKIVQAYPTLLPHSLKFYPIVQLASHPSKRNLTEWPPLPNSHVLNWARDLPPAADGDQVYIHVPFCPFLCHFCPLYKVRQTGDRASDLKTRFVDALVREIRMYASSASIQSRRFRSVYFGGGTPTELSTTQLRTILTELRNSLPIADDCELTLEGVVTRLKDPEYLAACVELGFTRLSFGVQTLDPQIRRQIGRGDNIDDYERFFELRRSYPQLSANVDLLVGLPGQSVESSLQDLETIRRWQCDSVDVLYYVMMPGTQLRSLTMVGKRGAPTYGDELLENRRQVNNLMTSAGWQQLTGEVFVANDRDVFTRTSFGGGGNCLNTLLALGPSAFGLVLTSVYQNVCDLDQYVALLDARRFPLGRTSMLTERSAQRRAILLSILRLAVPAALVRERHLRRRFERWQRSGLVECREDSFVLTERGRLWYNHMQMELLPWSERISSLSMFGSSQELLNRKNGSALPYVTGLASTVRGEGYLAPIRSSAFHLYLTVRSLPLMNRPAIGFTGPVDDPNPGSSSLGTHSPRALSAESEVAD